MQSVVSLKLTDTEIRLLDDLQHLSNCHSRSQTIRLGLLLLAKEFRVTRPRLADVREVRSHHRPRRSPKVTKMTGVRNSEAIASVKAV